MRNDIIGHWYLKDLGGPYRNFLDSTEEERREISKTLRDKYDRKYFHEDYLSGRDEVEKRLYQLFKNKGGRPEIERPVYCFLGPNPSELIYRRREEYAFKFFRISDFPSNIISFTYPGSIASIQIAEQERAKEFRSSYHGQVYLKEEIHNVIARHGMPGIDFIPSGKRQYDVLVEAQIWSRRIFDEIEELRDIKASWLPWITHPASDRTSFKKD